MLQMPRLWTVPALSFAIKNGLEWPGLQSVVVRIRTTFFCFGIISLNFRKISQIINIEHFEMFEIEISDSSLFKFAVIFLKFCNKSFFNSKYSILN